MEVTGQLGCSRREQRPRRDAVGEHRPIGQHQVGGDCLAEHAGVGGEVSCVDELRGVVGHEELDRPEADQRTDVRRVESVLGGDLRGAAERRGGLGLGPSRDRSAR